MKKKLIASLLTAAMVLSMTACGNSGGDAAETQSTASTTPQTSDSGTDTASTSASDLEPVTLKMSARLWKNLTSC